MAGKTKIGNWSDRLLVWYRLRIPVVHPHPKIPQVSPHLRDKPTPRAIQRDVMDQKKRKKKENMALIENELLQIINVFNYTDYT